MTNSYYSTKELEMIGFKSIGDKVYISRKSSIYGAENIVLGNNIRIDDFCILSGRIEIGNYVHIAAYSALYGGKEGIFVDDFANISSSVKVYSKSDDYTGESMTNPMVPEKYKNVISAPVYIKKHVIIGSTSVVLPGVELAEGCAFGAFSFIDHSSEPWTINAGIPFKAIKNRSKEVLELEKELVGV